MSGKISGGDKKATMQCSGTKLFQGLKWLLTLVLAAYFISKVVTSVSKLQVGSLALPFELQFKIFQYFKAKRIGTSIRKIISDSVTFPSLTLCRKSKTDEIIDASTRISDLNLTTNSLQFIDGISYNAKNGTQ